MKIIFKILILFSMSFSLNAQQKVDCTEAYGRIDSLFHWVGLMVYDQLPEPLGGMTYFYKSIQEKTDSSTVSAKVFVQFVIDTTGRVQCARVVKTENGLLNNQAIALIEETEFIPAEQRGRKVVSMMVLPIYFGVEPEKSKAKKCKK